MKPAPDWDVYLDRLIDLGEATRNDVMEEFECDREETRELQWSDEWPSK
jgi:hypothetical protein